MSEFRRQIDIVERQQGWSQTSVASRSDDYQWFGERLASGHSHVPANKEQQTQTQTNEKTKDNMEPVEAVSDTCRKSDM